MDNTQNQITERPISPVKNEIIKEAQRLEESLKYSSKGHFFAAHFWRDFHLWLGLPMASVSAIAGAFLLSQFDPKNIIAGILALIFAGLSSIMTFLNPNEKASSHLASGNKYDALLSKVRIFWTSESVLNEKLKYFYEQKDLLNQSSIQIPSYAYKKAKKGIEAGESNYTVDQTRK